MLRRFSVNFTIFSILVDASLTFLALHIAVAIRPLLPTSPIIVQVTNYQIPLILYILIPGLWLLTLIFSSLYDPRRIYKVVDELQQLVIASVLATLLTSGLLYLGFRDFSRWLLAIFCILSFVFMVSWRLVARSFFRMGHLRRVNRRVLIAGAGQVGRQVGQLMHQFDAIGYQLVGFLDDRQIKDENLNIIGKLDTVRQVVNEHSINDVVVALPRSAYGKINELVIALHDLPINVRVVPDYFSLALYRASVDDFGGIPMINLRDPALNDVERILKRLFDIVAGGLITLIASPILLISATIIWLDSSGPILFRQDRVGENGRIFHMYKFRTMIVGAEKLQHKVNVIDENGRILANKSKNDPRITRIGRFLRQTSLDELPQLFNVLQGDMSLVGPRPEMPWMVEQYEPWQRKRFAVPQGMTGWWQVNGRADRPMHLHTEDDLYYVQNYSLWMDLYILIKTPWVVLRGKGAY